MKSQLKAGTLYLLLMLSMFCIVNKSRLSAQAPAIVVQAPLGGERLATGQSFLIRWQAVSLNNMVDISLWDGRRGRWTVIASGLPAGKESYRWEVPQDLAGDRFRVKVASAVDGRIAAMSPTFFFIELSPEAMPREAGLPPIASDQEIHVQPTPSQTYVQLSWAKDLAARKVTLLDILGNEVISRVPRQKHFVAIPVRELLPGLYMAEILFVDGSQGRSKVLIEH